MELWFHRIAPRRGIPLNELFFPNNRPFPDFFGAFFFLIPIPIVFSGQLPINGGGLYIPILGAPFPPLSLLVPIRGAPLPLIFFIASIVRGTPIDAKSVPRKPPD